MWLFVYVCVCMVCGRTYTHVVVFGVDSVLC